MNVCDDGGGEEFADFDHGYSRRKEGVTLPYFSLYNTQSHAVG